MSEIEEIAKLKALVEQLSKGFKELEAHVAKLETKTESLRTELRATAANLEAKLEKFMEDMRSEY